ncbi:LuxR C-terminal-related transcriptional regulator [Mailhella massiliensis]|uniref:helix-turn-helix transcriptional regulator n=1 Tax=Mailhella massiliensis TaxID=1903261 RepID=UPI0009FB671F
MSKKLGVSRKTIYRHLEDIRKKLNVNKTIKILCTVHPVQNRCEEIKFTPRGREVFHLILKGKTSTEIATLLNISRSGVRRHQEKMLLQNNCNSMLELVAKYYSFISEM